MKIKTVGLLAVTLVGLFGISLKAAEKSQLVVNPEGAVQSQQVVMLKVNGHEFTVQDYATFIQGHQTLIGSAMSSSEGKAAALREMAASYMLSEQLFKEKLVERKDGKPPTQQEAIKAYEALAEKYFPYPPAPDEKSAYAYYEAHPEGFGIPESVRLSQIFFRVAEKAPAAVENAARDRAEKALKRLAGGEAFEVVAVESSENPIGKVAKGDIGFVLTNDKPWLKAAIGGTKMGERTGIVRSPEGFEILELTDHRPALITPYANVHDKVIKIMRENDQQKLRYEYVKLLAKNAKIEIIFEEGKQLFPNGLFP